MKFRQGMEAPKAQIVLSSEIRERAERAAQEMFAQGAERASFLLNEGGEKREGVISQSPEHMIPLGEVIFEGKTFYVGLPTKES